MTPRADDSSSSLREKYAPERQVVIAAIGADWDADQGDDGPLAAALAGHELPSGVRLHELGTGALDIAYDVMRGYDALILVDVSAGRDDDAVFEADEDAVDATIEDGQDVHPQAMDMAAVLGFIKNVGGWPGKVVVVPCAPGGGAQAAQATVERVFAAVAEAQQSA